MFGVCLPECDGGSEGTESVMEERFCLVAVRLAVASDWLGGLGFVPVDMTAESVG